ncbi:hypothetical protein ACS0TY_011288 [Phlomoides rotata]
MELNPHLSDCVLASLVPKPDQASGYNAPEVTMSGLYTLKSDVYSFDVVMLEILTRRKPFDRYPFLHDQSNHIQPSLAVYLGLHLTTKCPEPEFKPLMSEVVQTLVSPVQRANMSKRTFGNDGTPRAGSAGDFDDYTP